MAKLIGESEKDIVSENYGQWRFVFSRGRLRYTQASEGARRWIRADYRVNGHVLTMTITANGGEAPNDAAEKPGEVFKYRWSLYRDRLTLGPVKGAVSPSGWYSGPGGASATLPDPPPGHRRGSRRRAGSPPRAGSPR